MRREDKVEVVVEGVAQEYVLDGAAIKRSLSCALLSYSRVCSRAGRAPGPRLVGLHEAHPGGGLAPGGGQQAGVLVHAEGNEPALRHSEIITFWVAQFERKLFFPGGILTGPSLERRGKKSRLRRKKLRLLRGLSPSSPLSGPPAPRR